MRRSCTMPAWSRQFRCWYPRLLIRELAHSVTVGQLQAILSASGMAFFILVSVSIVCVYVCLVDASAMMLDHAFTELQECSATRAHGAGFSVWRQAQDHHPFTSEVAQAAWWKGGLTMYCVLEMLQDLLLPFLLCDDSSLLGA